MDTLITHRPCTSDECIQYQAGMENFARMVRTSNIDLIMRYIADGTPQYDGTLDNELKEHLNAEELLRTKRNVKFFCLLGQHILELNELVNAHIDTCEGEAILEPSKILKDNL